MPLTNAVAHELRRSSLIDPDLQRNSEPTTIVTIGVPSASIMKMGSATTVCIFDCIKFQKLIATVIPKGMSVARFITCRYIAHHTSHLGSCSFSSSSFGSRYSHMQYK